MKGRTCLLAAAIAIASGCALGPDYTRPELNLPDQYRGTLQANQALAWADADWATVFADEEMAAVIRLAVERNLDMKVALVRIDAARAQLTSTRSRFWPSIDGGLATDVSPGSGNHDSSYSLGLLFNWELDIFGKLRRADEAAQAELLRSEDVARAVMSSLVATTATTWLTLRQLDNQVAITRDNIASQEQSLALVRTLMQGGVASGAEEQQAITQLAATRARLPQLQQQVVATENALNLLLGNYPVAVPRTQARPLPPSPLLPVPGVPSVLLERRPDVHASEMALNAATARIGVAVANRFPVPTIGLGGFFGRVGVDLGDVFSGDGATQGDVFSWGPNMVLPLLDWGRGKAGVTGARANAEIAALSYRSTVLNAMREVSDAMASVQYGDQVVEQAQVAATAAAESLRLQDMRYRAGVVDYLDVLDAQRQQYSAQIALSNARLAHLLGYVDLYRALGGGWSDAILKDVSREPAEPLQPATATHVPTSPPATTSPRP